MEKNKDYRKTYNDVTAEVQNEFVDELITDIFARVADQKELTTVESTLNYIQNDMDFIMTCMKVLDKMKSRMSSKVKHNLYEIDNSPAYEKNLDTNCDKTTINYKECALDNLKNEQYSFLLRSENS